MSAQYLNAFAALLAVGIIVVGARFLLWPDNAARDFGLPSRTPRRVRAWLGAKGVRDIASGIVGLAFVLWQDHEALGLYMVCASTVPAGDAVIVMVSGGNRIRALGVHGGTAILMIAIGGSLLLA